MKSVLQHATPESASIDYDLRELLSAKLQIGTQEIPGAMSLGELGFDSLALSDLAEAVEEKFDVQIPNRMFPATLTIHQLVALLGGSIEEASKLGPVLVEPAD
jgi:acyl carrier protein